MNLAKLAFLEMAERKHQLLTSLTAVTLGIAAIVGVQTIAMRSQIEVAHQVDALGANIIVLPKSSTVDNYYRADLETAGMTIPESYVNRILFAKKEQGLQGVDNLSPKLSMPVELQGRTFTLTGILPKNEFMAKAAWSGGVFDTPTSCASDRKSILDFNEAERLRRKPIENLAPDQCLVGADLAELLKLQKGGTLTVLKKAFSIVDVVARTGTIDDARVFIHLHALQKLANRGRVINAIEIVGCCNEIAAGLVDKLNTLLPDAKVVTISQVVSTQRTTNQLMHNLTYVFLIVIILVGGASIANYMYANAFERRREIGTLMALGATPGTVLRMFLAKAFVIGVAGGLLGALIGTGLAIVLGPKIAHIPVVPIPGLLALGVGLSAVLSLLASVLPSLRAARTDPCLAIQDL
jgi:putative ABC transport system permease protein